MTMDDHLNFHCPGELRKALDAWAAGHGLNRSAAVRLAVEQLVSGREPYIMPTLPNWQVEAWTALLRGLFGDMRLVLIDRIKPVLMGAMSNLNERDAQVLRLRFGLDGRRYTGAEVAAVMGWADRQRVHQVERLALARVRGWCQGRGIWDLLRGQLEKEQA